MLVECLLNQLCAKEFISRRQLEDFMYEASNTEETVRRTSDKNLSLEEEVTAPLCLRQRAHFVFTCDSQIITNFDTFWHTI